MERPRREENLNALTHGLGTVLSLVATTILLSRVDFSVNPELWFACVVYGLALISVYLNSTLSHLVRTPDARRLFRQLDQAFIYLLIVATYTPFALVYLRTPFWFGLVALMWLLAVAGFLSKLWIAHRVDSVSVISYVALGWMPLLGGTSLFRDVPFGAVGGIVVGGILYTMGTLFLVNDRKIWYFHGIWHLFVIAGSAVHWWTTMKYVV